MDSDGAVYIGRHWHASFDAFNGKTGERKWEFPFPHAAMVHTPAIGSDGTLYIGTERDKSVRAIDSKTGKKRWSFLTKNEVACAPVIDS